MQQQTRLYLKQKPSPYQPPSPNQQLSYPYLMATTMLGSNDNHKPVTIQRLLHRTSVKTKDSLAAQTPHQPKSSEAICHRCEEIVL